MEEEIQGKTTEYTAEQEQPKPKLPDLSQIIQRAITSLGINGSVVSLPAIKTLLLAVSSREDTLNALWTSSMEAASNAGQMVKIKRPPALSQQRRIIYDLEVWKDFLESELNRLLIAGNIPEQTLSFSLPEIIQKQSRIAYAVLRKYDLLRYNPDQELLFQTLGLSLLFRQRVELVMFACPVLNSDYLSMETEDTAFYMSNRASGSPILTNKNMLRDICTDLYRFGIPTKLTIIMGDNDEEAYIFPSTGIPANLDTKEVEKRMREQIRDLRRKIVPNIPIPVEVQRWTKMQEKIQYPRQISERLEITLGTLLENPLLYFTEEELLTECEFMRKNFGIEGYYDFASGNRSIFQNITDAMIRRIVALKFYTYARQGAGISFTIPYAILIQNETPPLLRTRMINAATANIDELRRIPAVYPFII